MRKCETQLHNLDGCRGSTIAPLTIAFSKVNSMLINSMLFWQVTCNLKAPVGINTCNNKDNDQLKKVLNTHHFINMIHHNLRQ